MSCRRRVVELRRKSARLKKKKTVSMTIKVSERPFTPERVTYTAPVPIPVERT
jgi:hypothetical protein